MMWTTLPSASAASRVTRCPSTKTLMCVRRRGPSASPWVARLVAEVRIKPFGHGESRRTCLRPVPVRSGPSDRTSRGTAPPPVDELRRDPEGHVHGEDQDDLQLLEGLIAPTIRSYAIGSHGRGCSRHGAPTRCAWSREIRRRLLQARETGGPPSWRRGPPDSDGILARRARDSEKRSWRYSGVLQRGARPEVRKKCRRGV